MHYLSFTNPSQSTELLKDGVNNVQIAKLLSVRDYFVSVISLVYL